MTLLLFILSLWQKNQLVLFLGHFHLSLSFFSWKKTFWSFKCPVRFFSEQNKIVLPSLIIASSSAGTSWIKKRDRYNKRKALMTGSGFYFLFASLLKNGVEGKSFSFPFHFFRSHLPLLHGFFFLPLRPSSMMRAIFHRISSPFIDFFLQLFCVRQRLGSK